MLLGLILALVSIGDAPFPMPLIEEAAVPARAFRIDAFGARPDGSNARAAIAAGVKACVAAGGGRVVVPPGRWVTGAIRLASNVALHLEKGSELVFTQDPSDYLPAVRTSWEGVECCNYAPCVSAFGATNVAITGEGTLRGFEGDYTNSLWYAWARPPAGGPQAMASTRRLYDWMSDGVPVERRRLTDFPDPQTRPHLVQFNRCRNVLMDGFTVRESPFWTLHVYKCENVVARHLDVEAHGHNTDGIDIESSRNCLVEDSRFNQGDDGFVIKAGRNRDGWELAGPAENIVIRRCHVERGHTLLGIGSELSGGIRNVALYDCTVGKVYKLFFVKTNPRRGGFVENIHLANVRTDDVRSILSFGTGFYSRWKNFPDREIRLTRVDGLHVSHVDCNACDSILDLVGDARLPARNVFVSDVFSRVVRRRPYVTEHVECLRIDDVGYGDATDDIVFLGGDFTQAWMMTGRESWKTRLCEGRFGFSPKVVVLEVGANDAGDSADASSPPIDAILGVWETVKKLRATYAEAKVILHPTVLRNGPVNSVLRRLANGRNVLWCDFDACLQTCIDFALGRTKEPSPVAKDPPQEEPRTVRPEISMYWLANTNAAVKTRILDKRRERVANAGRDYDAIWLGDSITHFWEHPGKEKVFREKFGRYRIFNAGFGGDRVENVLWNLRYGGVLDGVRTRLVTLMIGTNNIWSDSAEDIAAGIALCVKEIRARQPQAKILLHSLLPREVAHKRGGRDFRRKRPNVDEVMPKLKRVNELIRPLADDEAVIFVDLFPAFLDAEGLPNIDLLPDGTHPGPEGLAVWADSVLPMYRRILGDVL